MRVLKTHARLGVVIAVTIVATLAVPAVARQLADVHDATNAHKVDGRHAVGFGASVAERSGELVATHASTGLLPNNIIEKAPNANRLDGVNSSAYVRQCRDGSVKAYAWIIAPNGTYDLSTAPNTFTPIFANASYNCSGGGIYLRRDSVGEYYVGFSGLDEGRIAIVNSDTTYGASDVMANGARATNFTIGGSGTSYKVSIRRHDNAPKDSPFLITVY